MRQPSGWFSGRLGRAALVPQVSGRPAASHASLLRRARRMMPSAPLADRVMQRSGLTTILRIALWLVVMPANAQDLDRQLRALPRALHYDAIREQRRRILESDDKLFRKRDEAVGRALDSMCSGCDVAEAPKRRRSPPPRAARIRPEEPPDHEWVPPVDDPETDE
jgi:hypothetical protein